MSEDEREKTIPKEVKKETDAIDENLNRGDVAAQEQKRILKQAKEDKPSSFLFHSENLIRKCFNYCCQNKDRIMANLFYSLLYFFYNLP